MTRSAPSPIPCSKSTTPRGVPTIRRHASGTTASSIPPRRVCTSGWPCRSHTTHRSSRPASASSACSIFDFSQSSIPNSQFNSMAGETWFLFDLGNTVIKLAYERVLEGICRRSMLDRDELVQLLEAAGGYRDLERGVVTFWEFYEFLCDKAGYRGSIGEFQDTWSDFFDGPIDGIEEVLDRVRERYRVAFLSNSNEVHADVIPRRFSRSEE